MLNSSKPASYTKKILYNLIHVILFMRSNEFFFITNLLTICKGAQILKDLNTENKKIYDQ